MNKLSYTIKIENKFIVFIILCIVLLYPSFFYNALIYLPQLFLGMMSLYALLKVPLIKPVRTVLFFAIYMILMSFIFSLLNNNGGLVTIAISSLRLFYPFIGLIIGGWFSKKISLKSFLYLCIFFLVLEFIIGYLQINNTSFRIWSYNLYRPGESAERYLSKFIYSTGKRVIGTIGNPNVFGLIIILLNTVILIMTNMIQQIRKRKVISVLSILMSTFIIINTQSRTGILLLVLTVAIIIFKSSKKKSINQIMYFILSFLGALLLLLFIQSQISREISFYAMDSRLEIWKTQISSMYELSTYGKFLTSLFGVGFHTTRNLGTFDNQFVKIFVSSGFIGLFIYLKLILDVFKSLIMIKSSNKVGLLGFIIVIVWLLGSLVADYQEIFKLSITTFIIIGYSIYSNYYFQGSLKGHSDRLR